MKERKKGFGFFFEQGKIRFTNGVSLIAQGVPMRTSKVYKRSSHKESGNTTNYQKVLDLTLTMQS